MADETIETLGIALESDSSGYATGLDEAAKQTDSFISSVGSKFESLGGIITGVGLAAGGALLGIGVAAWDMSSQAVEATNQFQAALGLTKDEAEGLSDIAVEVFGENWGNSLDDVSESLLAVKQQMRGLADDDLKSVTESAIAVRDVFGIDIAESTAAANVLMTQFGLDSDEAFDFIVAGNQRGMNASGDFLETIQEYSPQFASGGASAEQFFSVLDTGFVNGVLGTDKAADAFKEFRIRVTEGSDVTAQAITDLGINADDLYAGMMDGSITAADSFDMVMKGLNEIKDPIERNRIGVTLLGTQWEDLGPDVASSLSLTSTSMDDLAGATDSLGAKYNTLGSMMTGVWRQVQVNVLKPIGDSLLQIANEFLPYVQDGFRLIGDLLSGELSLGSFIQNVGTWIAAAWPGIQTGLESLLTGMMGWVSSSAPGWIAALSQFTQAAIQWVADALPGVVSNLASMAQSMISWVMDNLPGWITALGEFASKAINWVLDALPGLITNLGSVFMGMQQWVLDSLPGWGTKLGELGAKLIQWVSDALPGLGTKLGEVLVSILSWLGDTIVTVVPKLAELGGKFIAWVVTDVLPTLPGKLIEIGTAILTFLGNILSEVGPKIGELAVKFYDWVTTEVLPKIPGVLADLWNTISGWISDVAGKAWEAVKSIGKNMVDGIVAGIESMGSAIYDALIGPIEGAADAVADFLGIKSPSRLMAEMIGAPMMQGVGVGLESEAQGVQSQFQAALATIISPVAATAPRIAYEQPAATRGVFDDAVQGMATTAGTVNQLHLHTAATFVDVPAEFSLMEAR